MSDNCINCGHAKSQHIYEEGACRPGFLCECIGYAPPKKTNGELDHPCKQTCSGWKQGHEKGLAEGRQELREKRSDHAKGWWLDLSIEELREEFACLEEIECENQAAVAEFGAHCAEKSTDGIYALGNMLHDAQADLTAANERERKLREALDKFKLVYTAGADGERAESCCNGDHFSETLMAGDQIYRVSYAHVDALSREVKAASS